MTPDQDPEPLAPKAVGRGWLGASALLRAALSALGLLGFAGLFGASLLIASARWFWLGEIAASFAWQLGWWALGGALCLLANRQRKLGLAALGLALLHLYPELVLYLPARAAVPLERVQARLRVANCNLLWTNSSYEGLRPWIAREDPDVLVFEEVSPAWKQVLEGLSDSYPQQLFSPSAICWDATTWGTAILSRLPFESTRLIPISDTSMRPLMECVLRVGDTPLTLRGAHPMRPGTSWRIERRSLALDLLAGLDWSPRSLLLGDLNTSTASPAFADLLAESALRDSRQGFGRQPSYVTIEYYPGLEIAIDHVLISDGLQVLERHTSPLPGSDHRMVVAELALVPIRE